MASNIERRRTGSGKLQGIVGFVLLVAGALAAYVAYKGFTGAILMAQLLVGSGLIFLLIGFTVEGLSRLEERLMDIERRIAPDDRA